MKITSRAMVALASAAAVSLSTVGIASAATGSLGDALSTGSLSDGISGGSMGSSGSGDDTMGSYEEANLAATAYGSRTRSGYEHSETAKRKAKDYIKRAVNGDFTFDFTGFAVVRDQTGEAQISRVRNENLAFFTESVRTHNYSPGNGRTFGVWVKTHNEYTYMVEYVSR